MTSTRKRKAAAPSKKATPTKITRKRTRKQQQEEEEEEETTTTTTTTRSPVSSDAEGSENESDEEALRVKTKRTKQTDKKKSKTTTTATTKKTSSEQRLASSLQSFNTQQSQQQDSLTQQEFDYDELFNPDYLDAKVSPFELVNRLKKVHLALKHYEQLEDVNSTVHWEPAFLEILMHKKLLHNKSEEAMIYLSCIFADLIRVTIPLETWLYESANDMRQMFLHILRSLRKLGSEDDAFSFTRFYLLERLSVSKAFVLLTNEEMNGENIIDEVFAVFFSIVQNKTSFIQQAVVYMEEIMVTLIENSPVISTSILKHLLKALVAKGQPIAAQISKTVFNRTAEYIAHPLCEQLNYELEKHLDQDTESGRNSATSSKERASLFKSIIALAMITSRLLLETIPILINNLKSENLNTRSDVVLLLGTMFNRPESTLVEEYQELFKTLVDRSRDVEPRIRIYMAKFMQTMLLNHGNREEWIMQLLNDRLVERARDADEKVRRNVCEVIVTVLKQNSDLLTMDTVNVLAERARDKKIALRIHVMKMIAEVWRDNNGQGEKIEWIANCVVHSSCTVPNHALLETLLDKHMLAQDDLEDEEDQQRTNSFIVIVEQLDTFSLDLVKQFVFNAKNRYRILLKKFITLCTSNDEDQDEVDLEDKKKQVETTILTLAQCIPDRDEQSSVKIWDAIRQKKDLLLYLKKIIEPEMTQASIHKLKTKIIEKNYFPKLKDANDYLSAIIQKASPSIISRKQVEQIISAYIEKKEDDILKALLCCADSLPYLFCNSFSQLAKLLNETDDDEVVTATLKILLAVGKGLEESHFEIASSMESRLLELAENGNVKQAKYAARVISKIYVTPDLLYAKLFEKLITRLEYNDSIEKVLSALGEIAAHGADTFSTEEGTVVQFIIDELILKVRSDEDESTKEELNLQTRCRLLGCRTLSSYLVSMITSSTMATGHAAIQKRVVDVLWNLLEHNGNILSYNNNLPKKPFGYTSTKDKTSKKNKKKDQTTTTAEASDADQYEEKFDDGFGSYDAAMVRMGCVKSLIDLSSCGGHVLTLTNDRFLRLSYSILDPVPEVRSGVIAKLYSLLRLSKLNTRYLAMFLLGMIDPLPEHTALVKKYFSDIVPQLRREIRSVNPEKPPTLDSEGSFQIFPEYALPYLVYLLAHHPNFQSMEPDFLAFQKVLFTYFDVVTKGVDNLSFFHGLLTKIKTRIDAAAPDSNNHLIVCDLAVIILPRCAAGKNTSIAYPGKYFIPGFFRSEIPANPVAYVTPMRGFDTPRVNETPMGNTVALKHLGTLYLGKDFKLHEKLARAVGTPQVSTTKKKEVAKKSATKSKSPASGSKKSPASASRKRKATPDSSSRKKKKVNNDEEDYQPRQSIPRTAKATKKKVAAADMAGSGEEETSNASDREEHTSDAESNEPTSTVARRRRRRSST